MSPARTASMSVSSVTVPSLCANCPHEKRLRPSERTSWSGSCRRCEAMRPVVCFLLLVIAACGGTPSSPSGANDTAAPPPDSTPRTSDTGGSVALTDDFGGRQLFPADNWWNQDISTAPLDPQSDAYIDFIGRTRGAHPDFGPPPYGIPYVGVSASLPRVPVTFVDYKDESDTGFRSDIGYALPDGAT